MTAVDNAHLFTNGSALPPRTSSFWLANQASLEMLAAEGLTASEIGKRLGISRDAVLGRCRRTGVPMPMDARKWSLGNRKGSPRAFSEPQIAAAIAARLAGASYRKAGDLVGASDQSVSNWMRDPALAAMGQRLYERARKDAAQ
jgi:hypothetical protein